MDEVYERGYHDPPEKFVCDRHVRDDYLEDEIRRYADSAQCDYCDRTGEEAFAIPISMIVEEIAWVIHAYWDDAGNFVPWSGRDGGWQWSVEDIRDVLDDEFSWSFEDNQELRDDLFDRFLGREIAKVSILSPTTEEQLRWGWGLFSEVVKARNRYLFQTPRDEDPRASESGEIHPWEMLDRLGEVVRKCELIRDVPSGSHWYRARPHEPGAKHTTGKALGTVPAEYAVYSNRMSAAGIPMFYGSKDEATAVLEVFQPGDDVTAGRFVALRSLKVLDLANLPKTPSIFDLPRRELLEMLVFLQHFVRDLSEPVAKDGHEHIDYVPTQIVTEYFRHVFGPDRLDGLLYPSSKNPGAIACVLFFDNDACGDLREERGAPPGTVLALDRRSVKTHTGPPDPIPPSRGSDDHLFD